MAAPGIGTGTVGSPINLSAYVGLKNSDDQGTQFDLRAELYKNGSLIGSGQANCVTGITRNPDQAKNIVVSFAAFQQTTLVATDVLSVKVLTRIGTTATGTSCGGHASATGLRFYFDGVSRASQLAGAQSALAAPTLIRVYPDGTTPSTTDVIGRVDGAPSQSLTLQAYTGACTNGVFGAGTTAGNPFTVTTDTNGYFSAQITPGVALGAFVAVMVTLPQQTAVSGCLSNSGNDTWPRALQLGTAGISTLTTSGYIDAPGNVRWYMFDVQPGQRITVTLSGLPADYDLAVFKDIGATFLKLLSVTDSAGLTRLSAEYAPSVWAPGAFAPGAFAPGAFAPGAFAADAFAPGAFAPGAFAPGAFAPGAFAPGAFAPGAFAPGAFAPGAFAPGAFAPGAFAPGAFAPGAFAADELSKAFSSAQTRSIIGVSATPGVGDEVVVANSWNNAGKFYVRVVGRGGAFSTDKQFQLNIARGASTCTAVTDTTLTPRSAAPGANVATVILTDSSKFAAADRNALGAKLTALASRPEVAGVVVDVAGDPRVSQQLKVQAANNPLCPFATNLVAEEIKGIVDSYRANNPLRYVVIAGNDDAIPFFRYPDQSLLGDESGYVPPVQSGTASDASLRGDYVLSQDAYGAGTRISLRTSDFPVPGLAVGRLVETYAEIAGMIDAYASANGVVNPTTSLVTGYDFLADAAHAVSSQLLQGINAQPDELIVENTISPADMHPYPAGPWTATDLGKKLFSARHDVIFLAGHFSANSALAADFSSNLLTTDLAASSTDFVNSIVFSAGCHSGYNLVDAAAIPGVTLPLDWAQAFAQKKATLIAGTGYQYGDTDFIEYGERLYNNFARQLHAGPANTAVAVGEALVKAKLDYLAATPDIRGIHEKTLLEATLFGLPMLGVNMPAGRGAVGGPGANPITPMAFTALPGSYPALGLKHADMVVAATLSESLKTLTSVESGTSTFTTSYLSGPQGVVSNPIEPVLPLVVQNATSTDGTVLRGVGFRGGTYTDSEVTPLTGAPATEIRGVHVPFASPLFYPMRPWAINYYGKLSGNGDTSLLVTPVQHRASDIANYKSTRRQYSSYNLRLYYSGYTGSSALSDAPSIVSVIALPNGSGVQFTAQIVGDPNVGIQEAWIVYTSDNSGTWTPLDLAQCVAPLPAVCGTTQDSRIWMGQLGSQPANLRYVIEAANGAGLVTFDDNRGIYYALGGTNQIATTLNFVTVPAGANFGDTITVSAKLVSTGGVAGKNVLVAVGGSGRGAVTDANGNVTVNLPVVTVPGSYNVSASFAGDDTLLPSAASASFQVSQAPTMLTPLATPIGVKLTAHISTSDRPLLQESVQFTVTNGTTTKTVYGITDYLGQAALPPTGLPAGTYAVTASYAGNTTYTTTSLSSQPLAIAQQTITFGGAGLPSTLAYPGVTTFTVSSGSGQPVTVALSPNPNPACTLSSTVSPSGTSYTLTATAPGTCTIAASAGGTTTFTDVSVTANVIITQGDQTIVFAQPLAQIYGNAPFVVTATGGATGNPVTFTSATPAVCTVGAAVPPVDSSALVTIVSAGTCTIAAHENGNTFYKEANLSRDVAIDRTQQTITFGQPPSPAIYNTSFAVGAASTSALPVTIAAAGVCTISNGTVTMTSGTGTCTLTASQAGNANFYYPAADVVRTVQAALAPQTITFAQPTSPAAYGSTFSVSPSSSSGLAVAIAAIGGCSNNGLSVTMTSGTTPCTLTASQAGNSNYSAASVQRIVSASPATQTITFVGLSAKSYGDAPFAVSATAASGLSVTFRSTTAPVCTVSGNTVTIVATGTCTIAADQAGNGNYNAAAQVTQSFTVNKATQTISFPTVSPTPTFVVGGTGTFTVNPTATSGLAVTVSSLTPTACTVVGTTVTMKSAGLCTLAADQAGNGNYLAATQAMQSITIGMASQTITFANPGGKTLATPTFALVATASSGLPVTFGATGSCTVAGATLTLTATGSCTVTASQLGNANYAAASDVAQTFAIDLANIWTLLPSKMTKQRLGHTATRFESGPLAGQVLIVGGDDRTESALKSSERFNPATRAFTAIASTMPAAVSDHTATLLQSGKVIVLGGGSSTAQIFDPATLLWASGGTPSSTLTPNRFNHTATRLPDGRVLFVGGADSSSNTLKSTIVYDPGSGTFAAGPVLDVARESHTATLLPNGKVLIVGGRAKSGSSYTTLATYQLCDASVAAAPITCTTSTGSIGNRYAHAAVALGPDGSKVLVAGGKNGSTAVNTALIYDSALGALGTWSSTGSLSTARSDLTLSELPNGRALAAGGNANGSSLNAVDAYQPPFAAAAPMNVTRAGHTAIPLKDSTGNFTGILVVGGADGNSDDDDALDSAELYGTQ